MMADCSSSAAFSSSYRYLALFLTTLGVFFSTALVVIESILIMLSHALSPFDLLLDFSLETAY
jgi:hypothetical protein